MKILEVSFRKKGWFFDQVYRKNDLAIYKRKRVTKDAQDHHYEVIIIKEHPAYEMAGVKFEAGESYPGDNQWGVLGWTVKTEKEARAKLEYVKEHLKELELAAKKRGK